MDIKLLNDYILVKQVTKQETSGLEFAEAVNELIGKGEVVSIPEFFDDIGAEFPPIGSTVYFEKSLGTEFEINGEKVKFVRIKDIMGYDN
jgi:co-chaperonin GroES (HSP10)